jgi:hypothetical protein
MPGQLTKERASGSFIGAVTALISLVVVLIVPTAGLAMRVVQDKVVFDAADDFRECMDRSLRPENCHKALHEFLQKNNGNYIEAGHLVRRNSNRYNAAAFFKVGFEKKQGKCDDVDIYDVAVSALEVPRDNPLVKDAQDLAFKHCFSDWKADLVDHLQHKNSYYLTNACPELVKRKAITADRKGICPGA